MACLRWTFQRTPPNSNSYIFPRAELIMDQPPNPLQHTISAKRSSRVHPIEVQKILTNSGAMAAKPSPVEHIASPASPTNSISTSGCTNFQSHKRTMSSATEAAGPARPNRFSLSFPVQPVGVVSPTQSSQSPVRETAGAHAVIEAVTGPTDTNFLTAIAAQERKVLELKEELQRAEVDLSSLKKQWAYHEANKTRSDVVTKATPLQPLQTSLPSMNKEEDEDGSSAWMQQEMERRKALMNSGRSSNRTVFSGSRHTRTLSLLSPTREDAGKPLQRQLPPRKDSLSTHVRREMTSQELPNRHSPTIRASMLPNPSFELSQQAGPDIKFPDNVDVAGIDREALIRTGKKMATDFKDGLWTFFEDLRQATVGDEITQHTTIQPPLRRAQTVQHTGRTARKQSSKASLRPGSRGSSVSAKSNETRRPSPQAHKKHAKSATVHGALPDLADPSFWAEHSVSTPAHSATPMKKSPTVRGHKRNASKTVGINSEAEDAWDAWNDASPKDSRSSSAASESNTAATTVSGTTSPRPSDTARSSFDRKNPIPWPALTKLGSATLKRTASHLMNEWEKSLTPSPGKEFTGQEDYLGLSSEADATLVSMKQD